MSYSPSQSSKTNKQPPSFFRGLANGIINATIGGESSDDENGVLENDEYIQNGLRGIVVFKAYCIKTEKKKIFHMNLFTGLVTQYVEHKKKSFNCHDVQSISFLSQQKNVIVEIKKPMDVSIRQKKYTFDTDENGLLFKKYIEFFKEFGIIVRATFELIDRKGSRIISGPMLAAALTSLDINPEYSLINSMLSVNDGDGKLYDYHSFFHLFMDCEVSSIRECFLEWIQLAQRNSTIDQLSTSISPNSFETIPGEIVSHTTERVRWIIMSGKCTGQVPSYRGTFHITNYRIVLLAARTYYHGTHESHQSRFDLPAFFDVISIPLCHIYRISISQPKHALHIVAKDYRHIRITLSTTSEQQSLSVKAAGLLQIIEGEAFGSKSVISPSGSIPETIPGSNTFAFAYRKKYTNEGWSICDIRKEYLRQGLLDDGKWKMIDNSDWSYVESYPSYFVVPAQLDAGKSDVLLKQAIAHRSKGRLPVVTYRHAFTNAVMTRSAQPLVGITFKTSDADMKLLNLYRLKGLPPGPRDSEVLTKLYIFDARRKIAAQLNMAAGKGTEDASLYENTDITFCDIDNIHVMRNSAITFADSLLPGAFVASSSGVGTNNSINVVHIANGSSHILVTSIGNGSNQKTISSGQTSSVIDMIGSGSGYYSKLEDSGWLKYIRLILSSSIMVAEKMHLEGASVLVHCSDGWDRTSQICGIVQILLDPYFRTIAGFAVLIEKDWCAFGHKCNDRGGHGMDYNHGTDERSPVFLQFLDCVYQIVIQFPTLFEFNESLLCFIADHFYSGLFGNFLGNTDKQRNSELRVQELTRSIWSHILDNQSYFINSKYVVHERPIWPSCSMAKLSTWHRYFSRWDHEMHPNKCTGEEWHDDWGNGFETKPSEEKSSNRLAGRTKLNSRESGDSNNNSISNSVVVDMNATTFMSAETVMDVKQSEIK